MTSMVMKMMDVPTKQIVPVYKASTSTTTLNQMIAQIKHNRLLQECIIVEQTEKGLYYPMIAGYSVYQAYQLSGKEWITCLCRTATNDQTRRMDALLWLYTHSQVWMEKNQAINDLLAKGVSLRDLANYMGIKLSMIERYLIHGSVPREIIERAKVNGSSFPVINDIARLPFTEIIKNRLYERALLSGKKGSKLTGDKLKWIKKLLRVDHFMTLEIEEQWTMIEQTVFNYEHLITDKMKTEVNRYWLAHQLSEIK